MQRPAKLVCTQPIPGRSDTHPAPLHTYTESCQLSNEMARAHHQRPNVKYAVTVLSIKHQTSIVYVQEEKKRHLRANPLLHCKYKECRAVQPKQNKNPKIV